jgi:hypothetical protein
MRRVWIVVDVAHFDVISRIHLERLRKVTKNLSWNTLYLCRDSSRILTEYTSNSRLLPLREGYHPCFLCA